jgi:hypothetical protein
VVEVLSGPLLFRLSLRPLQTKQIPPYLPLPVVSFHLSSLLDFLPSLSSLLPSPILSSARSSDCKATSPLPTFFSRRRISCAALPLLLFPSSLHHRHHHRRRSSRPSVSSQHDTESVERLRNGGGMRRTTRTVSDGSGWKRWMLYLSLTRAASAAYASVLCIEKSLLLFSRCRPIKPKKERKAERIGRQGGEGTREDTIRMQKCMNREYR